MEKGSAKKRTRREWTLDERTTLQNGLIRGNSIAAMAEILGRGRNTVGAEIKANRCASPKGMPVVVADKRNICAKRKTCVVTKLCKGKRCSEKFCDMCRERLCNEKCPEFVPSACEKLDKPPYVCNGCRELEGNGCSHARLFYNASVADGMAHARKSDARKGVDLSDEELVRVHEIMATALKLGQSPKYIAAANPDLGVSAATLYRYVERGIGTVRTIDLPEAVKRRRRKKAPRGAYKSGGVAEENLIGRTIEDWNALPEELRGQTVEMDTVVGRQGKDTQCILTLYWPAWHFQLFVLLPDHTSASVVRALDAIYDMMGHAGFERWFGVIKTDRGSEFGDTFRIEHTVNHKKRCSVYYCDPFKSQQKAGCERNHRELRRILPKGKSNFDALAPADMAVLASHVNSKLRPGTLPDGVAPIDMVLAVREFAEFLDLMSIGKIPPNEVVCNPTLLGHAILENMGPGKRVGSFEEARAAAFEELHSA